MIESILNPLDTLGGFVFFFIVVFNLRDAYLNLIHPLNFSLNMNSIKKVSLTF